MDVFLEKIVERKKTSKDTLISIGIVLAIPVAFIVVVNIPFIGQLLRGFELIILVGLVYGAYHLIRSRNIEYEYIVTNGELDIDMIMARKKRKRIFSASSKDF